MRAGSRKDEFNWLDLRPMNKGGNIYYQVRLSMRLGRKTIGVGTDRIEALNLARLVDDEIQRRYTNGIEIDIDSLKAIVEERKQAKKEHKEGKLRLIEKDSLIALWEKYVSFHRKTGEWEESYYLTHIQTVGNIVSECPHQKLEQKAEIAEWIFDNEKRSRSTSKARFKLIVAAIDWNSRTGNVPRKWGIEYRDFLATFKESGKKKSKLLDEGEIDIFTVSEVYQILDALKDDTHSRFNKKHSQYYKYAYFCWLTGCRPSEAIALKWQNIDLAKRRIKFCEGQVSANGKIIQKLGTKTVETRHFPINPNLEELLTSIPHREGHVFLNNNRKPISQQAFVRVWRTLLESMGIKYRIPYQLRHTMISYHANNDYNISKLAEIVGNSEKIIREHYLRLDIDRISLPDVIKP